jgi:hypothetical protein
MKKLILAALFVSTAALAGGTPQNHHCEVNGATVTKTKKECKTAGGKWTKDAGAAKTAPAPAPAGK